MSEREEEKGNRKREREKGERKERDLDGGDVGVLQGRVEEEFAAEGLEGRRGDARVRRGDEFDGGRVGAIEALVVGGRGRREERRL